MVIGGRHHYVDSCYSMLVPYNWVCTGRKLSTCARMRQKFAKKQVCECNLKALNNSMSNVDKTIMASSAMCSNLFCLSPQRTVIRLCLCLQAEINLDWNFASDKLFYYKQYCFTVYSLRETTHLQHVVIFPALGDPKLSTHGSFTLCFGWTSCFT